jgi:hypothetical protein
VSPAREDRNLQAGGPAPEAALRHQLPRSSSHPLGEVNADDAVLRQALRQQHHLLA